MSTGPTSMCSSLAGKLTTPAFHARRNSRFSSKRQLSDSCETRPHAAWAAICFARMGPEEMQRLFERHRDAEAARDYDAILDTFVEECFLETHALGLRSEGRAAVRRTYEEGYFTAFPDLAPEDVGQAFGEDVMVVWGTLDGTSRGEWMGVPPSGRSFSVPFANVTPFRDGLMEGETIYFDLATLCEQAALPLDEIRAAARERAQATRSESGR